jgi:AraC family transcriptional regulator
MDGVTRLNGAMDYVEAHLKEEIEPEALARIACCSVHHFVRMFSYMAGLPLSEYIRRSRMTAAAKELANGRKVTDVALDFGYDSPTAFNRAFQSVHKVAPSKTKGATLKAFSPIRFKMIIRGNAEMDYRIENKKTMRIVGLKTPMPTYDDWEKAAEESYKLLPKCWEEANAKMDTLKALMEEPEGLFGLSTCDEGEKKQNYYIIGVATSKEAPEGFSEIVVPSFTYAVFPGEGDSAAVQELQMRIVSEWLPTSGFEWGPAPDLERYEGNGFEIWLPVVVGAV